MKKGISSVSIEKEDIENRVIDWINEKALGRLIIFKPEKKIPGVDLVVKQRGEYEAKEIFLKINVYTDPLRDNSIKIDIPQDELNVEKNSYLMFFYFDEVEQDVSDYVWVLPALFFKDSVDSLKSQAGLPAQAGKDILRFEASLDFKKESKYKKFLVVKSDLGRLLMKIIETKGIFDFAKFGFGIGKIINLQRLKRFIGEARRNTYAASAKSADNPRLLGSVQLEYQKADYFYQDIYFDGESQFIGQEVVYLNGDPVWAMNYFGRIIQKEAIDFLKEALLEMSEECRLGKTCEFEKKEFKYQDEGSGNLREFYGKEEIFLKEESIYKLHYSGGVIAK